MNWLIIDGNKKNDIFFLLLLHIVKLWSLNGFDYRTASNFVFFALKLLLS